LRGDGQRVKQFVSVGSKLWTRQKKDVKNPQKKSGSAKAIANLRQTPAKR